MEEVPDLSLKELKVCRKAFEEYYKDCDFSMTVDPRPGGGPKLLRNFVDAMMQARWCGWLNGWTIKAARKEE